MRLSVVMDWRPVPKGVLMTATSENISVGTGSVDDQLDEALQSANVPTLIAILAHLTGDDIWLHRPYAPERARGLDDNDTGGLPDDVQSEIREAVKVVTRKYNSGDLTPKDPSPERVAEILSAVLHEHVPSEYGPLLSEELGIISRSVH